MVSETSSKVIFFWVVGGNFVVVDRGNDNEWRADV